MPRRKKDFLQAIGPSSVSDPDWYAGGMIGLREVAEFLSVSLEMVEKLVASGELPSVKVGRRRLVSRLVLRQFLASRACPGKPSCLGV